MNRFPRLLLVLCLLFPLGIQADDNPDRIFVFGDSLSDTGNLAAVRDVSLGVPIGKVGLCNPFDMFFLEFGCGDIYFGQNRVSNGPVAAEVMAKRLGQDELGPSHYLLRLLFSLPIAAGPNDTNYAVAGALAGGSGPGDLNAQVGWFLLDQGWMAPPDALYVVIIGGNDLIDAVQAAAALLQGADLDEDATPDAIIDAAIDAIEVNIDQLIGQGGEKILVGNVPNIGALPAIRDGAVEASLPVTLVTGAATALTIKFNQKLARRLDRIRARHADESIKIGEFNVFGYFETVRFLATLFGRNAVDACFNTDKYQEFASRDFHPDCKPAMPGEPARYNKFVFFDDIHPTGWVHAAIGRAMARAARRLLDD